MADTVEGIALLLAQAGIGQWDPTGVYDGQQPAILDTVVPASPDTVVVLSLYPGSEGDGEASRNAWTEPRLQVRTRAGTDPRTARDLDRQVRDLLHAIGATVLPNGVQLTDCYSLQSAPMPMGADANGRWEYSRNYQLTID